MEVIYLQLRINNVLINIYRKVNSYFASIYGQLPIPFQDEDSMEQESILDLIILLTLRYCNDNYKIEVFNKDTNEWSNF